MMDGIFKISGLVAALVATAPAGWAFDKKLDEPSTQKWPKATISATDQELPVPARFKNVHEVGVRPAQGLPVHPTETWWKVFRDPVLDALEDQAVRGNQDLNQAVANIIQSREQARVVASDFFPQVSIPISGTRERTTGNGPITRSRIVGGGFPIGGLATAVPGAASAASSIPDSFAGQALTNTYSDYRGAISATYELDVFGRIRHNYGEARANAQASEADRNAVALSLNAQVASSYFALRAIDSQIQVLRDTLKLRQEAVQIQKQRLDNGHASQLEVAQADVELANTESDMTDAQRARGEQENALAVLCGQSATAFSIAEQPLTRMAPPQVPAGIPSSLLRRRPDIVEAERKLAAASEAIGAARAGFFPTFNLQGNYGTDSAYFDKLTQGDSNTWSVGFQVSIPVFEGGRNVANLKAARAQRDAVFSSYQQTMLTAFKEVENALVDLRQRSIQAETRNRAVASARLVFEASRDRYTEGAINYFDVIDSQRSLLNAQLSQVQTLNAQYLATVDLIRATGGSYAEPPKP